MLPVQHHEEEFDHLEAEKAYGHLELVDMELLEVEELLDLVDKELLELGDMVRLELGA